MSEVVYTIEKVGNELTFIRDEEVVKVSCATPEECGYTRVEGNFICYYDNELKLIKRKVM